MGNFYRNNIKNDEPEITDDEELKIANPRQAGCVHAIHWYYKRVLTPIMIFKAGVVDTWNDSLCKGYDLENGKLYR